MDIGNSKNYLVTLKIIYFRYEFIFLDQSIQKIFEFVLKAEAMTMETQFESACIELPMCSASVLAEISGRSPRKLFIFII